jgi:DNA polymerase-3 subunit epsilon
MFAVIDVETTGLSPVREKIIDIAVIIHDGIQVIDEFSSLIDPEKVIPANITRLTGITNEMIQGAPRFWEIARDLVLMTEGKTFVAHNVNFDYRFIRQEFASLGYDFKREKLCTLKLSRKRIPGKKSYGLGNLCKELGFPIQERHRAYGDARATTMLFQYLQNLNGSNNLSNSRSPISDLSIIQNLPEETGVYYFMNHYKEIIYIGKSKNIKTRVLSHFQDSNSRRSQKMIEQVTDVSFEITGSELVALLKESYEIKTIKPIFNRRQRRASSDFGIYYYEDKDGYIRFKIEKHNREDQLLTTFNSHREAKSYLFGLCEKNDLCQKLCGLYDTSGACFYYHLNTCRGACVQAESPQSYNERAKRAIEKLNLDHENIFILENGRNEGEKALVKIENGRYSGYGYIDAGESLSDPGLLHDVIRYYPDNQDVYRILRNYLRTRKVDGIINY